MKKETSESIIRRKRPSRAYEVDYKNGRKAAIDLNCFNCVGLTKTDGISIADVEKCDSYECFFWRYRPGKGTRVLPKGTVPTAKEYLDAIKKEDK